ncbi:MAG TPA: Xaa-Pro peptidase family protein [Bacillales bacterium]|nr:Xaa-Pro peptidase family protein [Bacillales bacterium]
MNERLTPLCQWLRENECDFAFIHSTANVFYLSGFHCTPHERLLGLLVFPTDESVLICPRMEVNRAKNSGGTDEIIGYSDTDDPWTLIGETFTKRAIKNARTAAIEKQKLPFSYGEALKKQFPHLTFLDADEKLGELRMTKDANELRMLREAARYADLAVEIGVEAIEEGRTEMEVLATIEYEMKKKGIREMAFSTMVLAGENAAHPHGTPGKREIRKGDFVLFDLGVVLDGYCSDITRTVAYGHVNDKQREVYETVLQAQETALALSRPGLRIGDLDAAARKVIDDAGYGEYFPHRLGHGLGIEAHEAPSMGGNNDETLKPGMVYTVEPGIYIVDDAIGVRIEDDVYLSENGPECLTRFPKTLQVIK